MSNFVTVETFGHSSIITEDNSLRNIKRQSRIVDNNFPWFIRERSSLIKLPDGATVTELRADLQDVITLPVIQNSEKRLNIQQQI